MLNGCNESELKSLQLQRNPSAYNYLSCDVNNNNVKASTVDKSDYKTVTSAMATLGFSPSEVQTIWSVVAGVLNLVIFFTLFSDLFLQLKYWWCIFKKETFLI